MPVQYQVFKEFVRRNPLRLVPTKPPPVLPQQIPPSYEQRRGGEIAKDNFVANILGTGEVVANFDSRSAFP